MTDAPSRGLRILLVEDSADDAELISLALRRAALASSILRVDTEEEFVAALDARPDVVLCDFHLPRFDCERAYELLRAHGLAAPMIVVSRHISAAERDRLLARGAAAFVPKGRLGELAPAITASLRCAPGEGTGPKPAGEG